MWKVKAKGAWWTLRTAAAAAAEGPGKTRAELLVYGDIGESWDGSSITARDLVVALNEIDADELDVRINSHGGSVSDGLAIHNALVRHPAAVTTHNDGVAYSIASLILMAGDEIHMADNALLMIHAPWSVAAGNAVDLRKTADILDNYAAAMLSTYTRLTGEDSEEMVRGWLNDGENHFFSAAEALEHGLITNIDAALPIAAHLDLSRYSNPPAAAAAFNQPQRTPPTGESTMNFKAMAAKLGIDSAGLTDADVKTKVLAKLALHSDAKDEAIQAAFDVATAAAAPAAAAPAVPATPTASRAEILAADKNRRMEIRAQFAPFAGRAELNLGDLQQQCEDDEACTAEAAGIRLLAKIGQSSEPLNRSRIEPGALDERNTMREGAAQAMLHRSNPSVYSLDERAKPFRGMRSIDLAREVCAAAGINTRGRTSSEIAVQALMSTDDFPAILENVVTKSLRAAYVSAPRSFIPWTRQAVLPDFKQVSRAQLGGAPNLKRVLEGAEYEFGSVGEGAEKYSVQKYGRLVNITWETIVNDDMDAFTRVPGMFGRSAADLESDIVYAILTGNANMADGVALFHADHGNLGSTAAISETSLSEMRKLMLLQKGIEGRYITVRPEFLIVPPSQLTIAQKQLAIIEPTKGSDVNPFQNSMSLIVEPRLEDNSATAWYGAAAPQAVDTIEYAYLEGNEGVFTESKVGFEMDGLMVKCRHVFGAKAIDSIGLHKNAGA